MSPCGQIGSIYSVRGSNCDSDSPCFRLRFDIRCWDGAWEETAAAFADAGRPMPLEPVWTTTFSREFSTVSAPSVSGTARALSTSMKEIEATIASVTFISLFIVASPGGALQSRTCRTLSSRDVLSGII